MVLMFENNKGKEAYLGDFDARKEACEKMLDFLSGYKGYLWIDLRSHSLFFHLYGTEEDWEKENEK